VSRRERQKGARGERDLRDLFLAHGFAARRDGRLDADLVHDVPGIHVECKRQETLQIPKWLRQVRAEAGQLVPALFFRRSHEPWQVIVPAAEYLQAKRDQAELLEIARDMGVEFADPRVGYVAVQISRVQAERLVALGYGSESLQHAIHSPQDALPP
jgi:Holliday junction resolvase